METRVKDNIKADRLEPGWLWQNTRKMLKNPVEFLGNLAATHGPLVTVNFFGKKYFVIQHPQLIKHVLLDNHKAYSKPGATKILKLFLGEGLITTNGELWYKKRRLMQPAFHKKRLNQILDIINEETSFFIKHLNSISANSPVNFSQEMLQLNSLIVSRAMFGSSARGEMKAMTMILEELSHFASGWMKSIIKIPVQWPTPANTRFDKNCKRFDSIIYEIIDRKRKDRANPSLPLKEDLLDMLLDYVDEETGNEMSEKQLRDEVTTIFMAGHETTAQTLSWIFYQLAKEKEVSNKALKESINVLGEKEPVVENLSKLVYIKKVIDEGMRCYPSVSALVRKPYHDDMINGVNIPAGSNVLLNIYGVHHHPGFWPNPNEFNPDNFNESPGQERLPFTFLPFGGGPRLCIGHNFAMMVMQVVVSRLNQYFVFDLPEGYIPEVEPNITIRAKGGIQLLVQSRQAKLHQLEPV